MESTLLAIMAFYYAFILGLGLYMFVKRFQAVKNKRMRGGYFKLYEGDVPEDIARIGNNFNNQFQLPVIFLVTCVTALYFQAVGPYFVATAATFVLSRLLHSYIHININVVLMRAGVFFAGAFLVLALWIMILIQAS